MYCRLTYESQKIPLLKHKEVVQRSKPSYSHTMILKFSLLNISSEIKKIDDNIGSAYIHSIHDKKQMPAAM